LRVGHVRRRSRVHEFSVIFLISGVALRRLS
jgi:hypothetical protein